MSTPDSEINTPGYWVEQLDFAIKAIATHLDNHATVDERQVIIDTLKRSESIHKVRQFIQDGLISEADLIGEIATCYGDYCALVPTRDPSPTRDACQYLQQAASHDRLFSAYLGDNSFLLLPSREKISTLVDNVSGWYRNSCAFRYSLDQWPKLAPPGSVGNRQIIQSVTEYFQSGVVVYDRMKGLQESLESVGNKKLDVAFLESLDSFIKPDDVLAKAFATYFTDYDIHQASDHFKTIRIWLNDRITDARSSLT